MFRPSLFACVLVPLALGCASTDGKRAERPAYNPAATTSLDRATGAKVWVHDFGSIRVHTYMAPFKAFANTTHIVESPTALVVIDPQMTVASARDARGYADSLNKPIERLVVSHAHPDHYLGVAAAWEDVEVHALAATISEIRDKGEKTRQARVAMFPAGWLADHVTPPTVAITPGTTTIDGVAYLFERYLTAEHHEQLVVRLPELKLTVAQDLVYTAVHPVLTARDALDSWSGHVDTLLATGDTALVLPGHGPPTNAQGLMAMKDYLATAKKLLAEHQDPQAFKAAIMAAFPDRGGEGFVDFSLYFLFPKT